MEMSSMLKGVQAEKFFDETPEDGVLETGRIHVRALSETLQTRFLSESARGEVLQICWIVRDIVF